jgi:hypothetical protein
MASGSSARPTLSALLVDSQKLLASSRALQEESRQRLDESDKLLTQCSQLLALGAKAVAADEAKPPHARPAADDG